MKQARDSRRIDEEYGSKSHLQGIHRESAGRRASWSAGQQGDLCVGRAAVADGAVMLPAPAGEVPSQPPPTPPPLKLVLHLGEKINK